MSDIRPAGTCATCGECIPPHHRRFTLETLEAEPKEVMLHASFECLDVYLAAEETMYDDEDVAHEDMTP